MKGRRPRPDELDLWSQVARSTRRLDPKSRNADVFQKAPAKPARSEPRPATTAEPPASHPSFRIGEAAKGRANGTAMPASTSDRLAREPVRMDSKAFTKLKRGKMKPDARIDLHGMTLDQAHPALVRFILSAQSRGHRLVLVITGKGAGPDPHDPAPQRRGVLKSQVPQWLRLPPIGQVVLQISEAHLRHGGSGAYYVYLRKLR